MTSAITFLHTADIHLGAPIRGFRDLPDAWKARLARAIPEACDRVVNTALQRNVDFVILAGDAFDTSQASYGDYLHFFDALRQLDEAGIPVYLVPGNHDPFTTWQHAAKLLPPNAHLMGGEACEYALYERDGEPLCLIGARGYRIQAWPIEEPIAKGISRAEAIDALRQECPDAAHAPFSVGIIHTGLEQDQSKSYSDLQELLSADVDYWACGHLHEHAVKSLDGIPKVVFPGCVQSRDLKEDGARGCYVVTMERAESDEGLSVAGAEGAHVEGETARPSQDGRECGRLSVSLEFVPMASVVFHTVKMDVGACQTLADIAQLAQTHLFRKSALAKCEEMVVRIVLTGTTPLHSYLVKPEVIADLRRRINNAFPAFYCDTLKDCTHAPRNRATILREGLFEAHVLRVSDAQAADHDQLVNFIQMEFVKRGIDVSASLGRGIDEYNAEAEALVLDLLGESGE